MLGGLLPPSAAVVEAFADAAEPPALFPEEAAHVARAVESRRAEFATVRGCARDALASLGGPRVPLLPGERGAPGWPDGFVGSMTHCRGYRGAAVARAGELASVGIDAEPDEPLPNEGLLETIALPAERAALPRLNAARPGVSWDRLLFSAKESVYKAWFPLTRKWLDFEEARIDIDPEGGTFTATLLVPGPVVGGVRLPAFSGRFLAERGLVVTAIAVPHSS
ncbi:4'-phosphopantetheinyl transferase family protein [Streptomyces radicis]|uniref:4'-phosphopantetheinyl transferase superfamily protein n=1 Tax=Streptomyces radicis TaxID=1750517 RepID=A0A3A9WBY4_9ACTN|nr:4'-phosphopantetheinyl transferase superfamily protein [Streptomyces radicis]RKN09833.1 4'-phosphopantetheinyl transferase superfamily protein [Streptomyces radicis]RKN23470.1 4'-phosphopantetheinyl transferase superfamily protein [Streptomyces radicis]